MAQIMPKYHLACRRGGAFCKSIVSTARRGGVPFVRTKGTKIRLGAVPQDPLTLKLRLDTNDVNIVRTAPQIRSQGACGAFYFGFCRDRIKTNTL